MIDIPRVTLIEWLASILGVTGAVLLALNVKQSPYGFVFFLLSSMLFIWFAIYEKAYGFMLMQVSFAIINTIGIYRWLILP